MTPMRGFAITLSLGALLVSVSPAAYAQFGAPAATETSVPSVKLCKSGDIRGMWKLKKVFETPAGAWLEDFSQNPHQYLLFRPDSLYAQVKGDVAYKNGQQIRQAMAQQGSVPQQYVLGDKGVVYIYKNSVAESSYYCGVVQEDKLPYAKGDIVLTPAQTSSAQIFTLYGRPFRPVIPPTNAARKPGMSPVIPPTAP